MGIGVITHFHTDPAPPHFLGNGSSGAGTEERIKNKVAGIGGNMDDALNEFFRLGSIKNAIILKQS